MTKNLYFRVTVTVKKDNLPQLSSIVQLGMLKPSQDSKNKKLENHVHCNTGVQ